MSELLAILLATDNFGPGGYHSKGYGPNGPRPLRPRRNLWRRFRDKVRSRD